MISKRRYDVLVIGSGLAGIMAALSASSNGAKTCLVSDASLFGGSSFSLATWGLGMVSEFPDADKRGPESLFKALCDIGMDMNTPNVSEALIERSNEALSFLSNLGVGLLEPSNPQQREFVACFDHQPRSWHGFEGNKHRDTFMASLAKYGVDVITDATVLSLLKYSDERVSGALVLAPESLHSTLHKMRVPLRILSKATVLATGGYCGLYGRHLCSARCQGLGHSLALDAGASLVNLEFVQIMLGMLSPTRGIIFNEKLYRWTKFATPEGSDVFQKAGLDSKTAGKALESHSWHGPYTTRLESRVVDETLDSASLAGKPALATYDEAVLGDEAPEFVKTYFSWLRNTRKVDPRIHEEVGMFAHSCNGGIVIDNKARTTVPGLFACGECAGGVHGADRIGGLASMTAATFGLIAGEQAARESVTVSSHDTGTACSKILMSPEQSDYMGEIGALLDASCMVNRDGQTLSSALARIASFEEGLLEKAHDVIMDNLEDLSMTELDQVAHTAKAFQRLRITRAFVRACMCRTETRGPHHRTDFPDLDKSQSRPQILR